MTDNYPAETTWKVTLDEDAPINCVDGSAGGPYTEASTLHTHAITVCAGQRYLFEIFDSYGDGICCAYGEGYYYLQLNGVEMVRGGEFAGLETYAFTPTATHGGGASSADSRSSWWWQRQSAVTLGARE